MSMSVNLNRAEFIRSAASPRDFIRDGRASIVFAGKSNVGKSSVINRLLNRRNFARVGSQPGKTVHVNYFDIDGQCLFVDLPGYGYAKVSKSVSESWGKMMERYFETRQGLLKVIQLVDIRHEPSKQDVQMYDYLKHYGLDGIVVATKADKISRNQYQKSEKVIRQTLGMKPEDKVIPISSLKKTGHEKLLEEIERILIDGSM